MRVYLEGDDEVTFFNNTYSDPFTTQSVCSFWAKIASQLSSADSLGVHGSDALVLQTKNDWVDL